MIKNILNIEGLFSLAEEEKKTFHSFSILFNNVHKTLKKKAILFKLYVTDNHS